MPAVDIVAMSAERGVVQRPGLIEVFEPVQRLREEADGPRIGRMFREAQPEEPDCPRQIAGIPQLEGGLQRIGWRRLP